MDGKRHSLSHHADDEGGCTAGGKGEVVNVKFDDQYPWPPRVEQHNKVKQNDLEFCRGKSRARRKAARGAHGLGVDSIDANHPPEAIGLERQPKQPQRVAAELGGLNKDMVRHGLEGLDEVHETKGVVVAGERRVLGRERRAPGSSLGAHVAAREDTGVHLGSLPVLHQVTACTHPNADDRAKQADGSKPAVGLGQEHDQNQVQYLAPRTKRLKRLKEGDEGEDCVVRKARHGPRRDVVRP